MLNKENNEELNGELTLNSSVDKYSTKEENGRPNNRYNNDRFGGSDRPGFNSRAPRGRFPARRPMRKPAPRDIIVEVLDNSLYSNLPSYATSGSAGADLCAAEDMEIAPNANGLVSTGLFIAIPHRFEMQIRSRSGLALKNKVIVLNTPGTIDSDYRGEVKVILMNFSNETFVIKKGDRIAQMVLNRVSQCKFNLVEELSSTERNQGGFGSTGIRENRKRDSMPLYHA